MVAKQGDVFPDKELYDWVVNELKKRKIDKFRVGFLSYKISSQWHPGVGIPRYGEELPKILRKREVLLPLAIGLTLDNLATQEKLPEPLQSIVAKDLAEFSFDEALAVSLAGLYGSGAVVSFGNLDQNKVGIAKELDEDTKHVNTFSDDLAEALAAAVCARFAQHSVKLEEE